MTVTNRRQLFASVAEPFRKATRAVKDTGATDAPSVGDSNTTAARLSRRTLLQAGLAAPVALKFFGDNEAKAAEKISPNTADVAPLDPAKAVKKEAPKPKTVDEVLKELVDEKFIPDDERIKNTLRDRLKVAQEEQSNAPERFIHWLKWMRDNKILAGRETDMKYFIFNSDTTDENGTVKSGILESAKTISGLNNTVERAKAWYVEKKGMKVEVAYQEGLQEVRKNYLDGYINKYLRGTYKEPADSNNLIAGFYIARAN